MANSQKASIRILHIRQPFVQFEVRPWVPPLNIFEVEDGFILIADLAGVNPSNLQIDVHPSMVSIRGVRQPSLPQGLHRIHRMEISTGPFQFAVPLDPKVDPGQSAAYYTDGLLEVVLPFAREKNQGPVIIPVRQGGSR